MAGWAQFIVGGVAQGIHRGGTSHEVTRRDIDEERAELSLTIATSRDGSGADCTPTPDLVWQAGQRRAHVHRQRNRVFVGTDASDHGSSRDPPEDPWRQAGRPPSGDPRFLLHRGIPFPLTGIEKLGDPIGWLRPDDRHQASTTTGGGRSRQGQPAWPAGAAPSFQRDSHRPRFDETATT